MGFRSLYWWKFHLSRSFLLCSIFIPTSCVHVMITMVNLLLLDWHVLFELTQKMTKEAGYTLLPISHRCLFVLKCPLWSLVCQEQAGPGPYDEEEGKQQLANGTEDEVSLIIISG